MILFKLALLVTVAATRIIPVFNARPTTPSPLRPKTEPSVEEPYPPESPSTPAPRPPTQPVMAEPGYPKPPGTRPPRPTYPTPPNPPPVAELPGSSPRPETGKPPLPVVPVVAEPEEPENSLRPLRPPQPTFTKPPTLPVEAELPPIPPSPTQASPSVPRPHTVPVIGENPPAPTQPSIPYPPAPSKTPSFQPPVAQIPSGQPSSPTQQGAQTPRPPVVPVVGEPSGPITDRPTGPSPPKPSPIPGLLAVAETPRPQYPSPYPKTSGISNPSIVPVIGETRPTPPKPNICYPIRPSRPQVQPIVEGPTPPGSPSTLAPPPVTQPVIAEPGYPKTLGN